MTNADDQAAGTADDVVYCRAAVVAESVSDEDRSAEVIASTDDLDGHGTRIKQNWRLDRFRANPVVLFSHNSRDLPIGTASDVRITDGQLRAKLNFSTSDLNPFAEQVWRNVKAKTVRGVSVGFMPHSFKFEKENDRDIMTLDDNELFEISMTPVPSNPATLAQLRARAIPAPAPIVRQGDLTSAPAATPAQPEPPETRTMTTPAAEPNPVTPSIARALGLPPGASEADCFAAATRLRELELQVIGITGVSTSAEAAGAIRGLRAASDENKRLREENDRLTGERDKQNFEAQLSRGLAEGKLSVATAKLEREKFDRRLAEGRGAEAVADLKGFIDVAPTLPSGTSRAAQPAPDGTGGAAGALTWNGKSYAELKPIERHKLWRENEQLWRLMKDAYESSRAA